MPIRILIVDDHAIVRDGLKKLLQVQPGFEVVGEAADGTEAIQRTLDLKPDILLLDLSMPRLDGLGVLKALANSACDVRCILLTASIEPEETLDALRLGARGIVLKESVSELLYKCIRTVMAGEFWVGHQRIGDLVHSLRTIQPDLRRGSSPASTLTPRELQIIAAIVDGASNKDIAGQCGISEQTVKNHLMHIFDKLGVSNRLELALYVVHHKLLARSGAAKIVGPASSRRSVSNVERAAEVDRSRGASARDGIERQGKRPRSGA
jgi:two-component system, NarL family, nitrate/nitrite response regulator NarL